MNDNLKQIVKLLSTPELYFKYKDWTISKLIKSYGVKPSSMYQYFTDKQQLVDEFETLLEIVTSNQAVKIIADRIGVCNASVKTWLQEIGVWKKVCKRSISLNKTRHRQNARAWEYYCKANEIENIENYDKAVADNFVGWDCHHKLETHFSDGAPRPKNDLLSREQLLAKDLLWNRPAKELLFLKHGDHMQLHMKGTLKSEETKRKMSLSHKHKKDDTILFFKKFTNK